MGVGWWGDALPAYPQTPRFVEGAFLIHPNAIALGSEESHLVRNEIDH